MPQVTFYSLSDDKELVNKACEVTATAFANKAKIAILCANQADAEQLDELLWQIPSARFIPHNLYGEGPAAGTPVEICWQQNQLSRRQLLVNLSGTMPTQPGQYSKIIDFVPQAEQAKQAARVRYKQFQQSGYQMKYLAAEQ